MYSQATIQIHTSIEVDFRHPYREEKYGSIKVLNKIKACQRTVLGRTVLPSTQKVLCFSFENKSDLFGLQVMLEHINIQASIKLQLSLLRTNVILIVIGISKHGPFFLNMMNVIIHFPVTQEASPKWVGKAKNYFTSSKKWVAKCPFFIKIRQKSGWAHAHPAHPALTPL